MSELKFVTKDLAENDIKIEQTQQDHSEQIKQLLEKITDST